MSPWTIVGMAPLLAFDTATERASLALGVGDDVIAAEVPGGARASAALTPALLALLREGGVALRDLGAIAFGRGPGAFTGLRTACAVAQGLAFGVARPVIPIDTLLAIAEDARLRAASLAPHWRTWALLDARMGELYAAEYAFDAATGWSTEVAPLLATPAALAARWAADPPAAVAGEALGPFADALSGDGLASALAVPDARPEARALVAVARRRLQAGDVVDAARALPLYVRDKVALTTAEREQARPA